MNDVRWSSIANETKQHNPIMSHSQADPVTNGVGNVMEFLFMGASMSVATILKINMMNHTSI